MGERDPMRVPYKFGEVCEHGRLKRQCDECQLDWENRTLRTQLAEAKADNARLREAIESEPELPDDMPDEMWDALLHADRETMTEVLRACVRTTKAGILRAYTEGSK